MASRVDVNPELVLRALAHTAKQHGPFAPASPAAAVIWALDEIERLRRVELECTHETEIARLHTVLESRTPDHEQWEHAAQVLHAWTADTGWRVSPEPLRARSRLRVAQLGVELGLVDL